MYHGAQSMNADPDFAGSFRFGPDAVLVAGSGLIIRLRKDIVGSTPTRPTIRHSSIFQDVLRGSPKSSLGEYFRLIAMLRKLAWFR